MSTPSADARARAALSRLAEPDDAVLGSLVERRGAEEVLARLREDTLDAPRAAAYRVRLPSLDVDADVARAAVVGARLVVPGDEEWPVAVDDWGPRRPLVLWVRAAREGLLARRLHRSVAVVGARAATQYGAWVTSELGADLADRGWTVVSGAAYGIDAAAHRGALAAGGTTVAVLACGIDVAYPIAHHRLINEIADAGAVVSEVPPGARPTKTRFLSRNRLIAAMSRGTVVVEAALRSGALNTATHADELSRHVMAVPGPVDSDLSRGTHLLIRDRGGALVTDVSDVLDLVGDVGGDAAPDRRGDARAYDGLDETALRVLDALPAQQFAGSASLAAVAGLELAEVLRVLPRLALAELVETRAGGWRRTSPD